MNKVLICGDLHQNLSWIKAILEKEKPDHCYLLGDYFDTWDAKYDTKEAVIKMAEQVKIWLKDSRFTLLVGNHDLSYFPVKNIFTQCSGYDTFKSHLINSILKIDDWRRFKFHSWHNEYLLTHAGLSKRHIKFEPSKENIEKFLQLEEKKAWMALEAGGQCWLFAAGRARGGWVDSGGLTWLDWEDEFLPLKDLGSEETVPQIVGHSMRKQPRQNGKSWCIDCGQSCYGIFENDKFEVKFLKV
jgi:predicted phosphodiesterase